VVGTNSVTVDFNETLAALSGGVGADWTIATAGSSISTWAVSTVGGKTSLSLTGAFNTTAYLDITYNGSAIVDSNGDGLRYKAIAIGVSTSETINLSAKAARAMRPSEQAMRSLATMVKIRSSEPNGMT